MPPSPSQNQVIDGAEAERRRLPESSKYAVWHPVSGLIVSPVSRVLPHPALYDGSSTRLEDYELPRFLMDYEVYLAFYPRKPIYHGRLFSVLSVSRESLHASIVADHIRPGRYILNEPLRKSWTGLEDRLISAARHLFTKHPKSNCFPMITPPQWPQAFGYRAPHASHAAALTFAKRSREAFRMLSGFVTFTLSLWLGEYEEGCFNEAFTMLATRTQDPFSYVWLHDLEESIVGDLSPGLRPGGFLDPYTTGWGPFLRNFCRAGVPTWLLWGSNYLHVRPLDEKLAEHYFPPPDIIEAAKRREAVHSSIILPRPLEPPSTPVTAAAHHPSNPTAIYEAPGQFENPEVAPPPPPVADRAFIVNSGSGQRAGESWREFLVRMEEMLERRTENEDAKEKQRRLNRQAYADKGCCSKTAKVYIWEQDPELPSFWRREALTKAQVEDHWESYTWHQRRYWAHTNEWDLLDQLPRRPAGTAPDVEDEDYEEAMDEFESARTAAEAEAAAEPLQVQSLPFLRYLRLRHGFDADFEGSWYPSLHRCKGDVTLPSGNSHAAILSLLYEPSTLTLPGPTALSVVDFYNTATSAAGDERASYGVLPPAWDISQHRRVTPDLACDMRRVCLRRVIGADGGVLYVLCPPRGSEDRSPWYVATTSATAVLFVYRSGWKTMFEIGRGLLKLGIPFRTTLEIEKDQFVAPPQRLRARGLGLRPHGFQPIAEDFVAFEEARDEILRSSCGRAIRLKGGLVGRIASEVVTDEAVLDGPILGNEVVGYFGNKVFVDDAVDQDSLDIVCGVYHVKQARGGASVGQESLWPQHWTWMHYSGYAGDQWSPAAENFYQRRLATFDAKKFEVKRTRVWRDTLKFKLAATRRVLSGSERLAADFLKTSSRVY